jgi:hypothetical protein
MLQDRAHERLRVSIEGKILAPDLSSVVDCMIQDVSAGGALISVRAGTEVPDRFYLWQAQTGTKLECEVRWRRPGLVGLSFVAPETLKVRALIRACRPPVALRMPVPPADARNSGFPTFQTVSP